MNTVVANKPHLPLTPASPIAAQPDHSVCALPLSGRSHTDAAFTPIQQQHERDIQTAYETLCAAQDRKAMYAAYDRMKRLILARDSEITTFLEMQRLERVRL